MLTQLKYKDSGWTVCGDLTVLSMFLGQQAGYIKYPCFLREWDNPDKKNHWIKKERPHKKASKPGNKNVVEESLVDLSKVPLPPLHIKLGLMKQFVKALLKERKCFKYLDNKFPGLSEAKIREGVFVGADIRKLCKTKCWKVKWK
ncbi:hypothetical protein AVEN_175395-1 [Araneus ventricosus]|uniref:Uncharacterized protein n=1 Tax=Araneus ventricosus TaxID=182803 RepID=A0A4Y2HWC9_ARAVE|nr:hypothetical protein AVEN_175395-1 [Araneus ventricosus]